MNGDVDIYRKRYAFWAVGAFSAFLGTLDASIVNVSLPTLSREFSVPVDVVAWVVLAYALAVTSTLLLVGRLAVKKGYRFVYLAGFIFFTTGSLSCALSGSIWQLIGSRVVQGVGASFLMASGPALITRAFPVTERGKAIGMLGTVVGIGLMTGPPLGGFLVSTVGWHSIFLINIPVGIAGFIYAGRLLKVLNPDNPETRVDVSGLMLQAIGIIGLLLFLNRINSAGWSDAVLFGIMGLSVVCLAAFFRRERRTEYPLVGLSIFGYRQFSLAISVMVITFMCSAATTVLIPFYLEGILGLVPRQVGLVLMTIPVCTALAAPTAGRISDAVGYRFLTTLGLSLFVLGLFWISTLDQDSSRLDVVLRLIVLGIGLGTFQTPNSSALMTAVPKKSVGIASGLLAVGRNLGITSGVAISTAIFVFRRDLYLGELGPDGAFIGSFSWVIKAVACLAIAGVLISATRKNRLPEQA